MSSCDNTNNILSNSVALDMRTAARKQNVVNVLIAGYSLPGGLLGPCSATPAPLKK